MNLYTKICVALFGICAGIVVLFAADMVLNSGRFLAHTVHTKSPKCSETCHGAIESRQDTARPAPRMALPPVQATHRLHPVESGAGGSVLLGVRVEVKGRN